MDTARRLPPHGLLTAALGYAARGWLVIPLHDLTPGYCSCSKGQDCQSGWGKHPRLDDWTQKGSTEPAQLSRWWKRWPSANVGIVTGKGSRLAVVDVDPRNGGELTLDTLWATHGHFPDTPMVLTGGGGQHYYFTVDDPIPSFDLGPGINFQADGGRQVVAPPSMHQSGRPYSWEASADPDDIPLAPLPRWILAAATAHEARVLTPRVPLPETLPDVTMARLKVSARIKYLIQTGEDPDNPARYPSRSEKVSAVLHAMIAAEHDDATMAAVLLNAEFGISDKPLGQKNARSPRYQQDTLVWVSGEIARARARHTENRTGQGPRAAPMMQGELPEKQESGTGSTPSLGWNDYVNALALVLDHGDNLRYCYPWKSWLVWNGQYWERDTSGKLMRLAKQTIKQLARRAAELEDDKAKALFKHVKESLSTGKLKAMIESAQSELGIPVQPEDFDTHPLLLNVQNGTIDLTTGICRPHNRDDLLTKCLPYAYDAHATCPTWEHFLWRIMGGTITTDEPEMSTAELESRYTADERARALTGFLQRAIGYALTGSTREQCLFILQGITKTGKSTFLATLRALFGPYGQQADMGSFMHKDRQEVRNDLADLAGSRFVCALESQEGQRLAESLVKQLTGGADMIKARFLFQEYFTFKPQFKIFLGTNHKPVIKETDGAIWERIRLVPFTVQIPVAEQDKSLDEKLQQELSGIAAWALRGCLEWQRRGDLCAPEAVIHATARYREESDTIGRFIEECCLVSPQVQVKASEVYDAYKRWCEASGEHAVTLTKFGSRLEDQGFSKEKKGTVWRKGLTLI